MKKLIKFKCLIYSMKIISIHILRTFLIITGNQIKIKIQIKSNKKPYSLNKIIMMIIVGKITTLIIKIFKIFKKLTQQLKINNNKYRLRKNN